MTTKHANINFPLYTDLEADDPWKREYYKPPKISKFLKRSVPIRDVRSDFEEVDGDSWKHSQDYLRRNGFTILNHPSVMFDGETTKDFDDASVLEDIYYPECIELLKKATGAKHVFVTNSTTRQSHGNTLDTSKGSRAKTKDKTSNQKADEKADTFHTVAASTANIMHVDYTPRGARKTIRHWKAGLLAVAQEAGIIQREDHLCGDATNRESDQILETRYNENGKGPRYACFSIWRPLAIVTRDPMGYAPRSTIYTDGLIAAKYENRAPGDPSLGGDFTREQELFMIQDETVELKGPEFLYVSEQKPAEVTIFKLFDSAALGNGTLQPSNVEWEASGIPHSSLDIGDAGYGLPRKSIDVRCIAVW